MMPISANLGKYDHAFPPPFQGEGRGGDGVGAKILASDQEQPHPHPNLPLEGEGTKGSKSASMGVMPHTIWLCCGVVRAEMEELHRQGLIDGELLFLDSMLHMNPQLLTAKLTEALEQQHGAGSLVVVYGDCTAHMLDLVRNYRVGRVPVINCAQLLLGRDRYRQLMHEEAFLVLPEWAVRWEQIMKNELGLNKDVARDLMGEHRGALVYLDTGLVPVPEQQLQEFSVYTGLPWRVEAVSLDNMLAALLAAQAVTFNLHKDQV